MPHRKLPDVLSVEVPGLEKKAGETIPRRNFMFKDALLEPDVENLYENFLCGLKTSSETGECFGTRQPSGEYKFVSYGQFKKRFENFASGLLKHGLEKESIVGLYSINCLEWVIAEYACYCQSFITCPIYDTLGEEAIEHIVNQTEMKAMVLSASKASSLFGLASKLPTLKTIVFMDTLSDEHKSKCEELGWAAVLMSEVEKEGEENPAELVLGKAEDLATICYTSGTTGLPKGVMLTHKNIISVGFCVRALDTKNRGVNLGPDDVHISYLPLAHIFERAVMALLLHQGSKIGFYSGDTLKLLEDIAALKPTMFVSVPRLLNRVYDKVLANIEGGSTIVKTLFNWAYNDKVSYLKSGHLNHAIWDTLVFGKVRARLGGRVRFILTGAAPISADVLTFLRVAFSCNVFEGYGQTENGAAATMTVKGDFSVGHVGVPQGCVQVKLVDVPEMNYTSEDKPFPRGEICIYGSGVTKGYYKMPEKTKEDIDEDGYLHSGDIGLFDERGCLRIIDRKKNIFKLAQGEYIAPEKVEIVYGLSKYVAQAFVYGDSLKPTLVGIIIPDEDALKALAGQKGISGSFAELCADKIINKAVLDDIVSVGKQNKLKGFEQVKAIHLSAEPFSVENNTMTPTFKLKRPQAKDHYKANIDEMYAALEN